VIQPQFYVGKTNGDYLNSIESGLGRPTKKRRFLTMEDAENFIENHLKSIDVAAVERGEFYLDGPEIVINNHKVIEKLT